MRFDRSAFYFSAVTAIMWKSQSPPVCCMFFFSDFAARDIDEIVASLSKQRMSKQ